jgi:branched-chain amino acid aminotransferase
MTGESSGERHLWLNGEIVPWDGATVHISALGSLLNVGTVGEGLRAYRNTDRRKLFVFRLQDHMERFDDSMKLQRMDRPYTPEQTSQAVVDLLKADGLLETSYISPRAFFDPFATGSGPFVENPASAQVMIYAGARPSILPDPPQIHCCVSSWTRQSDSMVPPRIKGFNYQNNRLAAWEAHINGYDNAIMLNAAGKVSEAPAACLFIVRDGVVITPTFTSGTLESITRRTLMELFENELEAPVVEREVDRTELYVADEAFLCGTGAEMKPVASFDRFPLRTETPGPLTEAIRRLYYDILTGKNPRYEHWLTEVN